MRRRGQPSPPSKLYPEQMFYKPLPWHIDVNRAIFLIDSNMSS
jgi:hypothetical protein